MRVTRNRPKAFVELGRAGDIINVLPLARQEFLLTGIRPYFYVAEAYASLLEGVSYVEPLVYAGNLFEIRRALSLLRSDVDKVVCQVSGDFDHPPRRCWSFARDSWIRGSTLPFADTPPIFDRRDRARERRLIERVFPQGVRPFVLVATEGISTPFPDAAQFVTQLSDQLAPEYVTVDLSKIRAERFYDLLGLMDLAHCLVTIDTGTIHLAAASSVPVVALASSTVDPWFRAPWRKQEIRRFYYEQALSRFHEIVSTVKTAENPSEHPTIFHLWSHYLNGGDPSSASERRRCMAMESWLREYATGKWEFMPIVDGTPGVRVSSEVVGDTRNMPMVKDMFEYAEKARETDILCLCNSDIGFVPGITGEILRNCAENGAIFTHRHDFDRVSTPLNSEAACGQGQWYCGTDLFACTKAWWVAHRDEMPDMVFGCEFWDCILRQIVKRGGGVELHNAVYHEKHESSWSQPDFKATNAGHKWNVALAETWFAENRSDMYDPWRKTWNLG